MCDFFSKTAAALRGAHDTGFSKAQLSRPHQGSTPRPLGPKKQTHVHLATQKHSATGARARVARVRAEYPSKLDYSRSCATCRSKTAVAQSEANDIGISTAQLSRPQQGSSPRPSGLRKPRLVCFATQRHSATGARARVARVRVEYPSQLDYSRSCAFFLQDSRCAARGQ